MCFLVAPKLSNPRVHLSSNGDLDLDTSLNVDDDLLDDLGGRIQVNQALVDAHLVHVPGLGTLTAGRLAGGNLHNHIVSPVLLSSILTQPSVGWLRIFVVHVPSATW
jgi:hypothetical protein